MKIKAAAMFEQGKPKPFAASRPLLVEEVDLAGPGAGEVLVEIAAAGLCHSDLSAIAGLRRRAVPTVVGHEASGIVRELGPGVTNLKVDDHVVMVFVASCGRCPYCDEGWPDLRESSWDARAAGTLQGGGRRLSLQGQPLHDYSGISAFAEYAVTSADSLVRIERDIPIDTVAIFGCAAVNTAGLRAGETMAVVGLGVGLSALLGGKAAGAGRIAAIDVNKAKLRLARELGATEIFDARDPDRVARVRAAFSGGVHHAFEMAGSPSSMATAYAITRRGDATVSAALPDAKHTFALPLSAMVSDERRVSGSYMGSCVPRRDIPRFLDLHRQGRLAVDRQRSGRVALNGLNKAFDRLGFGETVRDLLMFNPT